MKPKPILELKKIVKRFRGVEALRGVDIMLHAGEVHILMGANGAGKSTLVKILASVYQPDGGEIFLDGKPMSIKTPEQASELGISIVYQSLNLISKMDVGQNIFLNREPLKGRFVKTIDWNRIYFETKAILERLNLDINPKAIIGELSVAQQQMVEIAKALSVKSRILILDEPTSSLSAEEVNELFSRILLLRSEKVAILYISHRLEEINRIGDRVTVFRDGQMVDTGNIGEMSTERIIKMMLGHDIEKIYPWKPRQHGEEVLAVKGLTSSKAFKNITFSVKKGEILGITGLVGSKRTELVHAIFGAFPIQSGQVFFKGKVKHIKSPKDAINLGIGLLSEDKAKHGMFPIMSIAANATSSGLKLITKTLVLRLKAEKKAAEEYRKEFNIRTPSIDTLIECLSGGNQQKVMLAKALFTKPEVLIFDEPTKGIDVGAKKEIYDLMIELASSGKAIIMVSSEIPEILGMCDRILVMKEGMIKTEMSREEATKERILEVAL